MKQNIISYQTNITQAFIAQALIAQDYQRGWEIAQKEYFRQQKQEQRKRIYQSLTRQISRRRVDH